MEQYTKIIEFYSENQRSNILTQRGYRRYFYIRTRRSKSMINRLVARFRQQGAVNNRPGSNRHRSALTDKNIRRVQESIKQSSETLTRRRSDQLEGGEYIGSLQKIFAALKTLAKL